MYTILYSVCDLGDAKGHRVQQQMYRHVCLPLRKINTIFYLSLFFSSQVLIHYKNIRKTYLVF